MVVQISPLDRGRVWIALSLCLLRLTFGSRVRGKLSSSIVINTTFPTPSDPAFDVQDRAGPPRTVPIAASNQMSAIGGRV
ncbi:hypothetical protein V8E36_004583 [Tilletia maclaganii]